MKYFVSGYYGHRNTGDDALAAAIVAEIRARDLQASFRMPCQGLVVSPDLAVQWRPRILRRIKGASRVDTMLKRRNSDVLVFGSGSVLSDLSGSAPLLWRLRMAEKFRQAGKRSVAIGVGVGPLVSREGRDLSKRILHNLDHISVRDRISLALVQDLGVQGAELSFDPAVLLDEAGLPEPPVASPRPEREMRILGVGVCDIHAASVRDVQTDRVREHALVDSLLGLASPNLEVRLFVFNDHPQVGDRALAERIQAALSGRLRCDVVPYHPNPLATLRRLSECDGVLAMRLHAAVFAYISRKPFVLLSYHPKCDGFAGAVGFDDRRRFDANRFSPEDLRKTIREVLREGASSGCSLPIDEAKRKARVGFDGLL